MINTDQQKITEVLSRGVSEVVVKEDLEKKLLSGKRLRIYYGIDPTGSLLHLGHAVVLRKLQQLVDLGHEVILLIGDFTAKIGDPTGKDITRVPLNNKQIKDNFKGYKKQASKILDFWKIKIKYNSTWLAKLKFEEILTLASHFTVQQMLQREMFNKNLWKWKCPNCNKASRSPIQFAAQEAYETSKLINVSTKCPHCDKVVSMEKRDIFLEAELRLISLNEFTYPLMQGYDSVVMDVDVEIGGNDQMFNMLCGRTLQKIYNNKDKDILTTKLLLGTDGRKMSKTYDNAIYLTDTSENMYGKIMSIKDELIDQYFELCTNLDEQKIVEIMKMPNPRDQKALLAKEIVKMYHGEKETQKAEEQFNSIFRDKQMPTNIEVFETDKNTYSILDLLCDTKLAPSKNEARRLVEGGAVTIELEKRNRKVQVIDQDQEINMGNYGIKNKISSWKEEIKIEDGMVVQAGKRKFIKIKLK